LADLALTQALANARDTETLSLGGVGVVTRLRVQPSSTEPWRCEMNNGHLTFVIPTYRLREVGETVAQYDENFFRNGHALPMIVFDDSSPTAQTRQRNALERVLCRASAAMCVRFVDRSGNVAALSSRAAARS
jgi:hypothetical protein